MLSEIVMCIPVWAKDNFTICHFINTFHVGDVTIENLGGDCCGNQKRVLCNATEATRVNVNVNNVSASFRYSNADEVVIMGGFTLKVIDVIQDGFLSNMTVEITFVASNPVVTVTCATLLASVTIDIIIDSE